MASWGPPPAPGVAVREALEADIPAVVDVYIQAYAQPPWNERHEPVSSEGYLRWVLSQPGAFTLVSEAEGSALPAQGIVLASPRDYGEFVRDWERLAERPPEGWPVVPGRLGYIWEIAVRPEAQRQGHGAALLRGALERLRDSGVDSVLLRSSERAPAAVGLYRRFGFERLPVRERVDTLSGPWVLPLHGLP
jgi:ribosomal protein S18 acetylase RimI-like enzyme